MTRSSKRALQKQTLLELEQQKKEMVRRITASLKLENSGYGVLIPTLVKEPETFDPGDYNESENDSSRISEREKEKAEAEDRYAKQRAATEAALKAASARRMVEIFPPEEVEKCKKIADSMATDNKVRVKATLKTIAINEGRREIPTFKNIDKTLGKLKPMFGNFAGILDEYIDDLMFAGVTDPSAMHLTPRILNGPPGVGKTAFVQSFAKALGLPYLKLGAGGISHSSTFCGTSSHWSTSQPGEVFNLLALNGSGAGCAVLLLDEVDKINPRDDYGILPALLDLLEPETSRTYREESLGLTFNASHLIIIMTSNYPEKIDKALLSRCRFRNIRMPGVDQKMAVAIAVHKRINDSLAKGKRTILCQESLEKMVQSDMSIRTLIIQIQQACATALRTKSRVATLSPLEVKKEEVAAVGQKRSIGFVPWDSGPFYLQ
jgi:ATP-dependent Lon protease